MNLIRERLIAMAVCFLVAFFMYFPVQAIITSVVIIGIYVIFTRINQNASEKDAISVNRRVALETARIYLAPYDNIWNNLKLSNKYCSLKLMRDGTTIICNERNSSGVNRTFKVVSSRIYGYSELWNLFCTNFNHYKTYDDLKDDCRLYGATIIEEVMGAPKVSIALQQETKPVEKVDLNNASEVEITALPGISIVMSKKIIKKREEIGGFKNVNEFFIFMKLKPHMEKQLRELVCVTKMKGSLKIEKYSERNVDL